MKGETLMKTKKLFKYIGAAIVVLSLFAAVGTALGQESEPEPEASVEEAGLAGEGLAGEAFILAQPPYTMNYQGYLTDSSGNPLNGTYDLAFRLYDAPSGGNMEWGTEVHNNVQVTNGIFQVALGSNLDLEPNVFDMALYLAVRVEGTWIGRQPLRTVPYAFGLVPGARVVGNPAGTDFGLYLVNTGSGMGKGGIYARGASFGVQAQGVNGVGLRADSQNHSYAIYSEDAILSNKGYAGPDTYVWVPVQNAVIDYGDVGDDVHLESDNYGEMRVEADSGVSASTSVHVHIPIQVERPYGRDYLLRWVRVYYMVDSSAKLEAAFIRGRDFGTGSTRLIGANGTDGTSTSFTYYDIEATDYYSITDSLAPTNLDILIDTPNANSTFYLYGVRLELTSHY
jgi:hypothetical protein